VTTCTQDPRGHRVHGWQYRGDTITGSSISNYVNGFTGADTINVSRDPTAASDSVNCGGNSPNGDGVIDTVTKDPNDQTQNCGSDNMTSVP
jgi:hypothetical protein